MGSYQNLTASGQGSATFNGGVDVNVLEVFTQLVTAGDEVVFHGSSPARRIYRAGWIGLGDMGGGIYNPTIRYARFLAYETEDDGPTGLTICDASTVWWDFTPGTVVFIEVDW